MKNSIIGTLLVLALLAVGTMLLLIGINGLFHLAVSFVYLYSFIVGLTLLWGLTFGDNSN